MTIIFCHIHTNDVATQIMKPNAATCGRITSKQPKCVTNTMTLSHASVPAPTDFATGSQIFDVYQISRNQVYFRVIT
ncbi:hypothetical protein [Lapidilactobacillus luobeiensis]|uniref:hypothetical protein n=1 Tax=Lapidilactobacillus luobeiensis TaxID=2950371 RepID=UPI0021C4BCCD|nr:hypothetical protein [Lapidilactobacillus luobeiensis]